MLGILGFAKTALNFCLAHWKILLPLLTVVVGFFVVSNMYYNKGVEEERAKWEERVRIETEKNAKLTETIASTVSEYSDLIKQQNESRVEQEIVYQDRVRTIVQEKAIYQECVVDPEVIEALNAIRGMRQ